MKGRRAFAAVALVLLFALLAAAYAGWRAYYDSTHELAFDLVKPRNRDRDFEQSVPEDVSQALRVPGADPDVELDVWVIDARRERPPDSVDWVVILHGIADQKRTLIGLGRRFANHGVGSILVDLRGHGLSTVNRITFGARDVHDLSQVLDAVEASGVELGEVGVYGPSYGGAISLMFAAHDPRVTRAVCVGGFASFRRIVRPYLRKSHSEWAWAIPGFFSDAMVDIAGDHAGFDPEDASSERAVAAPTAPTRFLLVHSREDEIVPYQHAVDIVDACNGSCELLTLEGLDHLGSLSNQPLRERLHLFLEGQPLTSL